MCDASSQCPKILVALLFDLSRVFRFCDLLRFSLVLGSNGSTSITGTGPFKPQQLDVPHFLGRLLCRISAITFLLVMGLSSDNLAHVQFGRTKIDELLATSETGRSPARPPETETDSKGDGGHVSIGIDVAPAPVVQLFFRA